jgi:hypothetical protein
MMRKIEKAIIKTFRGMIADTREHSRIIEKYLSSRDTVHTAGDKNYSLVFYRLWSTDVIMYFHDRLNPDGDTISANMGKWDTVTTRSRINAFRLDFPVLSIGRIKGESVWADGIPYTGPRVFSVNRGGI